MKKDFFEKSQPFWDLKISPIKWKLKEQIIFVSIFKQFQKMIN